MNDQDKDDIAKRTVDRFWSEIGQAFVIGFLIVGLIALADIYFNG